MGEFEWFEVCRVCVTPKTIDPLTSLFDDDGEKARQLKIFSGIDITIDEGKRNAMICDKCFERVKQALIVRTELIDSEEQYFKICRYEEEQEAGGLRAKQKAEEAGGSEESSVKEEGQETCGSGELSVIEGPIETKQEDDATDYSMERQEAAKRRFECKYCSKIFFCKSNLAKHEVSHKGRRQADPTKKSLKPELEQRKATARGRKAFRTKCRICTKTFTDNKALLYHLSSTHADTSNARFQCDLCPKKFHYKSHMRKHLANHRNIKNWRQCPEMDCGRFFNSDFQMKQHAIYHSDVRPFVCWCERTFKFEHNLHYHQRQLHPEADHFRHICPVEGCKESFVRQSELFHHFSVHPDYRPFKCSTCGQSFKNKGQMYKHRQSIHQH